MTTPLVLPSKARTKRRIKNSAMTVVVAGAFTLAAIPLFSLMWTVISRGLARFDSEFFSNSMKGIVGSGGGVLHALVGTLIITLTASIMAIPLGILTAIFLVEYGSGAFARTIRFLVDVMTGIPSIVAGLAAYALFSIVFGPGVRSGFAGAAALTIIMTPVVVRATEEMLALVPMELREASYALGVPKYRTITKVVLPTALSGIVSGAVLGISRIVGETAPLLLVAGFTDSMNYNLFSGRMASLPVYIYGQWANKGVDAAAYDNRAWSAAMLLIAVVVTLHLAARGVVRLARRTAP
ncbi:MAG: phosphate ABC transporter permease PstA [Micrococcales bacterium]|nr:phosphate ABC transporter permease PstA [Micrococcales bacterium]